MRLATPALLAVMLLAAGGATWAALERAQLEDDDRAAARIERSADRHAAQRATARARRDDEAARALPAEPTTTTPPAPDRPRRSSATTPRRLLSAADRRSFARLARTLPGREGIAVAPLGGARPPEAVGDLRSGVAWSTIKVPLVIASGRAGVGTAADRRAAITVSDNAAAERLWNALGGGSAAAAAVTRVLRDHSDERTTVPATPRRSGYTVFGQATWTLTDQVRFAARLQCSAEGRAGLRLMRGVAAGQQWGLARFGRWALKGGWGPGITTGRADGWLDRQFGVVEIGGRQLAIAIATSAGDHATATRSLTRLAQWARSNVDARPLTRSAACG